MADPDLPSAAAAFGRAAKEYARARPSYPQDALDWLLPAAACRVLDLGAGSGQLTRSLAARGLDVTAVEPSAAMRAELTRAVPDADVLAGTAEVIPAADGSFDAVLVAQAWHWVDVQRAAPEVARVLKANGRFGLLWNIRDEREDWVAVLGRLLHGATPQDLGSDRPDVGTAFGPVERRDFAWSQRLTPEGLLDLVASRSYIINADDRRRRDVLDRVRSLVATHPALAGRDDFPLPYVTRCSRTQPKR